MIHFNAVVAGAGPAGLAAATLLARQGVGCALVCGPGASRDPRTVALMKPAIELLAALGVWPSPLIENAAPLRHLRMIDDTGRMFAAPEVLFSATELGSEAFGWNIPVETLMAALATQARTAGVTFFETSLVDADFTESGLHLRLASGEMLSTPVALAADGRESRLRACAGIRTVEWSYDQAAIATSFSHSQPHHFTSTEYQGRHGPFTTVPLPGNRSGLVWLEKPAETARLMGLDEARFAAEIQLRSQGRLGRISEPGFRRAFPMRGFTAQSLGARRVLLIGEAAHQTPPIGAQGLNLSLRDAAFAAELVSEALNTGGDPGARPVMEAYGSARRADVLERQAIVHAMNRSLLSDLLPVHMARSLAMRGLKAFPALRQRAMARGVGPAHLPHIMAEHP